jgi:LysR family hydrogen peroxide-inducible transcriptional activator
MVAAGVGCTLLPRLAAIPGVGSVNLGMVEIRSFRTPEPTRTLGLVWRHGYPREAAIRCLGELIMDHLPTAAERLPADVVRAAAPVRAAAIALNG